MISLSLGLSFKAATGRGREHFETVSAHQGPDEIVVIGVSPGAAMQNDDSRTRKPMSFSQEWHGYQTIPYTARETDPQFNASYAFTHSQHPNGAAAILSADAGFSNQGPTDSSLDNSRGMTVQKPTATPTKGKRVRTGCLTCRERHLKCDEALPDCMNCQKRGRECKRGVRLNFLEINLHRPASMPSPEEWAVEFQDESRDIASEYQGGLGRYAPYDLGLEDPDYHRELKPPSREDEFPEFDRPQSSSRPYTQDETTPRNSEASLLQYQDQETRPEGNDAGGGMISDVSNIATPSSSTHSTATPRADFHQEQLVTMRNRTSPHQPGMEANVVFEPLELGRPARIDSIPLERGFQESPIQQFSSEVAETAGRDILTSAEEVYYMQVFVEDVGVWMDSFNRDKHFSRTIPYHALKSTMLLNALLACGAKHVSLVSAENHDKALFYYNTATTQLLRSLQNPDRNTAECATTAIVLNVYEIMSEKPAQRMSHIAGSRALIRECGWNATTTGIGSACFWLNIGIEVLNCLATNWQTTWNPDEWGMDLNFTGHDSKDDSNDQTWVHRILYIVAKVANFRATTTKPEDMNPRDEQIWIGNRMSQWHELKRLCDSWNNSCPRTMHPFGYVKSSKPTGKSAFPRVWMIQREATIGRLLYHATHCILSQTHPLESITSSERMRFLQLHHAYQVCGIAAHSTDRGVAIVAIRCLAIAGAMLTNPIEQAEVLDILDRINSTSGWRLGAVEIELRKAWGWERMKLPVPSPKTDTSQEHGMASVRRASVPLMPARVSTPPVMAAVGSKTPVNPLSFADFKLPNHPYQNWYEPPNRTGPFNPPSL
ncbi:regulatory for the arginine catabolic pathway [Fusarium albosuccineum]|uniref:Regulatory for the arginine catabolic pathway n=1 Tax=Fusarium albosuccineum TaxID=1237068 RepID=A0A8H4P6J7_9HYPO|nr:regulatory for the arginine catabolic pathway [Fusarium albosuccineum]